MKIFVSGTVKDQGDLRDELYRKIKSWGHRPLCSEQDDFPTLYHKDAMTNCIMVTEECDLYVLILDKRSGNHYKTENSPYPELIGLTITEAEYRNARNKNKPTCIFIRKESKSQSKIYRQLKNKLNEKGIAEIKWYSEPELFEFFDSLMHEKDHVPWILDFDSAEEITLALQEKITWLEVAEKIKKKPYEATPTAITNFIDTLQSKIDYYKIKQFWSEFGNLTGKYNFDETLFLLCQIEPPFGWLNSKEAHEADTESYTYHEMASILDNFSKGTKSFQEDNNQIVDALDQFGIVELPNDDLKFEYPYQFGAIAEMVRDAQITPDSLQYYFYSRYEKDIIEYNNTVTYLFVIFMITYFMQRYEDSRYTHGQALDAIIQNKNPWEVKE